jgi:tryptophanyl-tRNA synthetase
MAHPERIEAALQIGAAKARALAAPLLAELRQAVGLRNFTAIAAAPAPAAAHVKAALPLFKQYREADGRFYFKLNAADGHLLLQSAAFADGRSAGQWVARLKKDGAAALTEAPVQRAEGVDAAAVAAALSALQAAEV